MKQCIEALISLRVRIIISKEQHTELIGVLIFIDLALFKLGFAGCAYAPLRMTRLVSVVDIGYCFRRTSPIMSS